MTEKPFLQESLSAITIITDVIVWYRQSMPSPLVNLRLILLKASEAETLSESVPRCPRRTFLQAGKGTDIKAHPGFTFQKFFPTPRHMFAICSAGALALA
jgi:hypothetical protein